jgi:subtilisin family serine protease
MRLFLGETLDGSSSIVTGLEYASPKAPDMESSTISGHSGSAAAISVAASPYDDPGRLENFSSRGPVTHYFGPVVDNHPAAPLPTPEVLAKPDIAATDGGANTFFGGEEKDGTFRFYGTSAAAPHVAAVLALMKQKMPKLTQAQALAILRATAHPIGEGGGAGLIDAEAALAALPGQ